MKQEELPERKDMGMEQKHKRGAAAIPAMLSIGGVIAVVGIAALVVITLPDIKRYIKISSM
jgi:hypothetical protein